MSWQNPRTANPDQSIWRDLPETIFRRHLVDLEECTNAVPTDMRTFSAREWSHKTSHDLRSLPISVEQQLADDFAFLSAVEEGAQSVSASCIEEHTKPPGLVVRFAALDVSLNDATKNALQDASELLKNSVLEKHVDKSIYVDRLFCRIIQLHFSRLLARLRSAKWQKPKFLSKSHKKPLWQDFLNLTHRIQFMYTKKEASMKRELESQLQDLGSIYESFEAIGSGSDEEPARLQLLVQKSFEFCTDHRVQDYARRLQSSVHGTPTKQVGAAIKTFRQVEKIAAYWRVSNSLVDTARWHPLLFQSGLDMKYLSPYESIPTFIGYESWAKTCHVHAEVQLAVHYDLVLQEGQVDYHLPRVIGTSKYLCYLCHQFLRVHGRFFPSNTHGRLYDQWTIPDRADFDEGLRQKYRALVKDMDQGIVKEIDAARGIDFDESGSTRWRAEPMTSRQNLLEMDDS